MVVSEEQNGRDNIHFYEMNPTDRNLLTDLANNKMSRKHPGKSDGPSYGDIEIVVRYILTNIDHGLPSKYPNSLFSKGVKILDEGFVGFIMKETKDKIVVFGNYVQRYDIPKSKTQEVEGSIILNMNGKELLTYEIDNYTPLPK